MYKDKINYIQGKDDVRETVTCQDTDHVTDNNFHVTMSHCHSDCTFTACLCLFFALFYHIHLICREFCVRNGWQLQNHKITSVKSFAIERA